jgi:hypothetical protein
MHAGKPQAGYVAPDLLFKTILFLFLLKFLAVLLSFAAIQISNP